MTEKFRDAFRAAEGIGAAKAVRSGALPSPVADDLGYDWRGAEMVFLRDDPIAGGVGGPYAFGAEGGVMKQVQHSRPATGSKGRQESSRRTQGLDIAADFHGKGLDAMKAGGALGGMSKAALKTGAKFPSQIQVVLESAGELSRVEDEIRHGAPADEAVARALGRVAARAAAAAAGGALGAPLGPVSAALGGAAGGVVGGWLDDGAGNLVGSGYKGLKTQVERNPALFNSTPYAPMGW